MPATQPAAVSNHDLEMFSIAICPRTSLWDLIAVLQTKGWQDEKIVDAIKTVSMRDLATQRPIKFEA